MPPATTRTTSEARLSRPQRVAEEIKDWVVEQGLRAGDRLPGEAALMARFGMAKGTIREAMRILEAQGLIRTRTGPGGGSFVHEVSRQRAKALLGNYFYFKNLTIGDIYQLRLALEPELAASVAPHIDPSVVDMLEEHAQIYAEPPTTMDEERLHHIASLKFHSLLAEQAANPLLGFVIDFMADLLSDITVYRRLYAPPNLTLWSSGRDHHARLLAALRAHDADEARAIMASHMRIAWSHMQGQEAEQMRRFISE
ncbi:FadR/GntR family transcriptional regulator [Chachezhania sediminis]|uniref:FadR/GntR family transcriptional regulator n=1 Tax=Chachezhania sediminis TaxID=2599291 RepID=UPI00131E570A|nr:FCD domain-containing protein [Chachezhania sediminis]